jgi:hypothetical protein
MGFIVEKPQGLLSHSNVLITTQVLAYPELKTLYNYSSISFILVYILEEHALNGILMDAG